MRRITWESFCHEKLRPALDFDRKLITLEGNRAQSILLAVGSGLHGEVLVSGSECFMECVCLTCFGDRQ